MVKIVPNFTPPLDPTGGYNLEIIYATVIGIIALFGTVWYLLWKHKSVDKFEEDFFQSIREWWRIARENYHRDLAQSKELIKRWRKMTQRASLRTGLPQYRRRKMREQD